MNVGNFRSILIDRGHITPQPAVLSWDGPSVRYSSSYSNPTLSSVQRDDQGLVAELFFQRDLTEAEYGVWDDISDTPVQITLETDQRPLQFSGKIQIVSRNFTQARGYHHPQIKVYADDAGIEALLNLL
jgi:hypothetical protein